MSWADDNLIGYDPSDYYEMTENEWEDGIHTDKNGIEYKLTDMTENHLRNTIKYFSGLDTSPLEKELLSRTN